jgi:hypothetical protein
MVLPGPVHDAEVEGADRIGWGRARERMVSQRPVPNAQGREDDDNSGGRKAARSKIGQRPTAD